MRRPRPLRVLGAALLYYGFAFVSPIALVAAPLALFLLLQRPERRETLVAGALLGYVLWSVTAASDPFARLGAAWVLLLGGAVVVAFAWRPPPRDHAVGTGLLVVAIAAAAAAGLLLVTELTWDQLRWLAERHYGRQASRALSLITALAKERADLVAALRASFDSTVRAISALLPALVLLQSLAALAMAWALYGWIARHPDGFPLPRLRDFRFNDHLVWGVVIALVVIVLPGLGAWRAVGGNLAVFFGGLYVTRGLAVLAALAAAGGIGGPTLALLGAAIAVLFLPLVAFAMLALGVSDTWMDWRRLAKLAKGG